VAERVGYSPSSYLASFSASENGVLVYDSAHLQRDQLAWFDRLASVSGRWASRGATIRLLSRRTKSNWRSTDWIRRVQRTIFG
jgi:hypothetical protein